MRIRNLILATLGAVILTGCAYDDYGYGYNGYADGYYHHHRHHHDSDYWGSGYYYPR